MAGKLIWGLELNVFILTQKMQYNNHQNICDYYYPETLKNIFPQQLMSKYFGINHFQNVVAQNGLKGCHAYKELGYIIFALEKVEQKRIDIGEAHDKRQNV